MTEQRERTVEPRRMRYRIGPYKALYAAWVVYSDPSANRKQKTPLATGETYQEVIRRVGLLGDYELVEEVRSR
jgi:hypothetical protein